MNQELQYNFCFTCWTSLEIFSDFVSPRLTEQQETTMYPHLCEAIADGGLGFDLRQAVFLFILFCHADLNQPMINWWFGLVVWDFGVTPKYDSSLSFSGIPFMSKLPGPKPRNLSFVDFSPPFRCEIPANLQFWLGLQRPGPLPRTGVRR